MKNKRIFLIIVSITIIFTPITLSAQMIRPEDICKQAKMDAHKDVNGCLWFSAFFFGYTSVLFIDIYPPPARLVGKSPEYVEEYIMCYKKEVRKVKATIAQIGSTALGTVVTVGFFGGLMWVLSSIGKY